MCPARLHRLTPDGLQPHPAHADSLAAAAAHEPADGVYTVANTTHGGTHVLLWAAHLDRLADSAARLGLPLTLDAATRARLGHALRSAIADSGWAEVRFRVSVSAATPNVFLLSLEPYTPPAPALYQHGVRVATLPPGSARADAAVKTTAWMQQRADHTKPDDVYELLLLGADGHILEGASSSFYALRGTTLHTAADGVLPSISRQVVLQVAHGLVPLANTPVHTRDVPHLSEAFLSSSSRAVIPVIAIDGTPVGGSGTPGPVTRAVQAAYTAWASAHAEPL